jgi:penicillin-binding protein-related factor A (putative recombinase)
MKTLMRMKKIVTAPSKYPKEDIESKAFASWLDEMVKYKKVDCFSHIPNETSIKNMAYLSKMKAMGKRKGVPDFIIVIKTKIIFIEMKRQKNQNGTCASVVSPEQIDWIKKLNDAGAYGCIAYGCNDAISYVEAKSKC